ncbi:MAG: DNA polymerase III subunit delta [Actinomycetota bacterium]|nr:DNA polymerase III subunit delta [Actinomycetota bacterium]
MADLKPAYLITGSDRPKVMRALRRLRERVGEDATEALSAAEAGGEDVVAACNAMGLFVAERRLVVVEGIDEWKAPETKPVLDYLANPAETTVLALIGAEIKTDSKLAKAVADVGDILAYELPKRGSKADLPGWVGKQFAAAGVKVDQATCRALVELVGDDLNELAVEVEKLVTWAQGDAIGEREVSMLVAARAEVPPFALTDSWGRRDVGEVLAASEQLRERSGDGPRDSLPRIVGLLTSHVSRVADCQAFAAEGVSAREAADRMKRNRYYIQKLFEQATNFTPDELRQAVVRLAELDLALKGGSRLPAELEFDRALIEITRARESAAVG